MRIAVVSWTRRRVGGAESYLGLTVSALAGAGRSVAFWHECDKPENREPIPLPEGIPSWSVAELGRERALEELRRWRPDVIYSHGMLDPHLEAEIIKIAPSVLSAHNYYGTCISGAKSFKRPVETPCARRFGWQCLLHYYPHRCGGWSPVTMLKLYRLQSRRLNLLGGYCAILTHSLHMRDEYLNHGFPPERVRHLSYYVRGAGKELGTHATETAADALPWPDFEPRPLSRDPYRLLFAGRMDRLKGGRTLIDALPPAAEKLARTLEVTFVGDGPDRATWERRGRKLERRNESVRVEFTGWLEREQVNSLLAESDLLIFPSLWPEPFGMTGPEAGSQGVPVAAFDVGGVTDWLIDGVNGHLAPGDPPTAEGLAGAIVKCLADPAEHARLSHGAYEVAQRFSMQGHLAALLELFEEVVRSKCSKVTSDK